MHFTKSTASCFGVKDDMDMFKSQSTMKMNKYMNEWNASTLSRFELRRKKELQEKRQRSVNESSSSSKIGMSWNSLKLRLNNVLPMGGFSARKTSSSSFLAMAPPLSENLTNSWLNNPEKCVRFHLPSASYAKFPNEISCFCRTGRIYHTLPCYDDEVPFYCSKCGETPSSSSSSDLGYESDHQQPYQRTLSNAFQFLNVIDFHRLPDSLAADGGSAATVKEDSSNWWGNTVGISSVQLESLMGALVSSFEMEASSGVTSCRNLASALSKAEAAHPGLSYGLVISLIRKGHLGEVSLNETLLRLQSSLLTRGNNLEDGNVYRILRPEEPFQELNRKSKTLKKILSTIPDEVCNRKAFLETIKEIASTIKQLLDSLIAISALISDRSGKRNVNRLVKEFVKYSKQFSLRLKQFFKERQSDVVFRETIRLIYQTNVVVTSIKKMCDAPEQRMMIPKMKLNA